MRFQGAILDVDGVLVDSPHSRAWRDALRELMDTEMAALGVARLGDGLLLRGAGADLVVDTLDAVSLPALAEGRLVQREDVPQR